MLEVSTVLHDLNPEHVSKVVEMDTCFSHVNKKFRTGHKNNDSLWGHPFIRSLLRFFRVVP